MANAGRPLGDTIPVELLDNCSAAGYSSIDAYCQKELGFSEQWAYQFFRRNHSKFAPYARMAEALEISTEDLADLIESGKFKPALVEKFRTVQKFSEVAKVSRNLIEDCSAGRLDGLCIFSYRRTMHQARLSLEILDKRVLS